MSTVNARFWGKVDKTSPGGCWLWTAGLTTSGYGRFSVESRYTGAHRFAYLTLSGPIPDGLELDHLCHGRDTSCAGGVSCLHRRCVNPDHLEPVTRQVNMLRGKTLSRINAAKTHCPQGHAYEPSTTYVDSRGRRHCRPCHAVAVDRYRARKRAKASGS